MVVEYAKIIMYFLSCTLPSSYQKIVYNRSLGGVKLVINTATLLKILSETTFAIVQTPTASVCLVILVALDIIATVGHFVDESEVSSLDEVRFVFSFNMLDETKAGTVIQSNVFYRRIKIIGKTY
jgi:hypothetical protein